MSDPVREKRCIFLVQDRIHYFIDSTEILYCQVVGRVLYIYCRGRDYHSNCSMDAFEKKLKGTDFCRVSRNFLVPLSNISWFDREGMGLKEPDKVWIPLGRNYKKEFIRKRNYFLQLNHGN